MDEMINRKDLIVMKLLHYFITEKNYSPVILQGAENEIWLENLNNTDYQIIRIVSGYLHNDEQYNFDLFKASKISSRISKKVFSYHMNILNIYTDLGDNVHLENKKRMDCLYLYEDSDIESNTLLKKKFPDILEKLTFNEDGMALFIKITSDINEKNKQEAEKAEQVFKKKTPYVTYIIMVLCTLIFFIPNLLGFYDDVLDMFCLHGPTIREYGEYYRIITCSFLHADIIHLVFNMYALYILGSQLECFLGRFKYTIIYIISIVTASLLSITLGNNPSVGASGAIFGIMGGMLYFGYHYRVFLGTTLKSQLVPLITINLLYGFTVPGIDNFAHIGGLIGGVLITKALGVKYKSSKSEIINGIIMTFIFIAFLLYMSFGVAH